MIATSHRATRRTTLSHAARPWLSGTQYRKRTLRVNPKTPIG